MQEMSTNASSVMGLYSQSEAVRTLVQCDEVEESKGGKDMWPEWGKRHRMCEEKQTIY